MCVSEELCKERRESCEEIMDLKIKGIAKELKATIINSVAAAATVLAIIEIGFRLVN